MIKKNVMRIIPSITLNATDGRTGCRYVLTFDQVFEDQVWFVSSVEVAEFSAEVFDCVVADAAGTAQPAAINNALVNSSGAATNTRTLKMRAKIIELTADAVAPFLSSSWGRFSEGTGNKPGTAPVIPAKSPSPSITAGVSATSTSFASSASANASAAE